jgi:major membrane immunogen (membrane-anchored lipoprotein)
MKKIILALFLVLMSGCSQTTSDAKKYDEGFYLAKGEVDENGWSYFVAFEIKNGKFSDVEWNAVNRDGGKTKSDLALNNEYVLSSEVDGGLNWAEQSLEVVRILERKQTFDSLPEINNEGKTDSITGVTVKIDSFERLVMKALENGPIKKGMYQDGAYYASDRTFENGYKNVVGITVKYGIVLSVGWNALKENEVDMTKREESMDGSYVLDNGNGLLWHEQVLLLEEAFIESQDITTITLSDEEGHTDSVSGATISVSPFVTLVEEAFANGPK